MLKWRRPTRRIARRGTGRAAAGLGLAASLALAAAAATPPDHAPSLDQLRRERKMADDLATAIASDAQSFATALTSQQVRARLEGALHKKLTDETLQAMAAHARAEADYWLRYRRGIEIQLSAIEPPPDARRVPGQPPPEGPPAVVNPGALLPPQPLKTGGSVPVPDRWRILDALGRKENPLDPYNTNTLKGDKPIFGDDWFLNLSATSDTRVEPARVPTGIGAQYTARPTENNIFGRYGRLVFNQTEIFSAELFKGATAFKPPDLMFRFTPVFNFNHTDVGEIGVIRVNPEKGQTRDDAFLGIQEAFVDYHIRNVSKFYDFDAIRVGIQPFNADFRGFLFQDNQLGVRLLGDRDANRWQYNLAYFRRLNKDTNSGLNAVTQQLRRDDIVVANLYRQDFLVKGFTAQVTDLWNLNREGSEFYYDKNGFLVRPAQIGDNRGYSYNVNYLGLNGDGHFGRLNLTTSAYWAFGGLTHNQFGANPRNNGATINAFFAAAEPSIDFDWIRLRASALFQSGDAHPQGGHATGFDAVAENPQFAGADTSFWIRQSIPLIGGGGVALSTENGVLADLRAAKGEGQSNFINPGLMLAGIGADFDLQPRLRLSTNFNYLRFVHTAPLEFLRHQADIPDSIGWDLSAALTYRPLFSQNIVLRLSGAILLPGDGLRALYNTEGGSGLLGSGNYLFSVLGNVIVTY